MSFVQRPIASLVPKKWAESMEAESRLWMTRCPCGLERSVGDLGGIRWKAAGNPIRLHRCPRCGLTWHKVYKKDVQQPDEHITREAR